MADSNDGPRSSAPVKSAASIVAIIAAALSFYKSSQGDWFVGLLCALLAIGAGSLGFFRSVSPRVSGGILSIVAVSLGVIAIVVAMIALVF